MALGDVPAICFNPRPLLLTGESRMVLCKVEGDREFQSTPVIANGRIAVRSMRNIPRLGFNPRPLLLTGESSLAISFPGGVALFQSTPVIANGRIEAVKRRAQQKARFQSTPVIANGRIVKADKIERENLRVSIHARYC